MRPPLTYRQASVLEFIASFKRANEYAPTTREIQKHFGFRSQTAAVNHVNALRQKGYIAGPRLGRALVVVAD